MACTGSGYIINGVDLSEFGFKPSAPVALSGMWDMPARIEKTSHSWLDENYLEAYVREDEIFFAGRDLTLRGYIPYEDSEDLGAQYYALNEFLDGIALSGDLATLTTAFGEFEVLVTSFSIVELCPTGYAEIAFMFRENSVSLWGSLPTSESGGRGVNGYSWGDFGAYMLSAKGAHDRGTAKLLPVSVYGREEAKARRRNSASTTVELIFRGDSLSDVGSKIGGFARVLASEGRKILNIGDGLYRLAFVINGFTAELVRATSTQVYARVSVRFEEIYTSRELVAFDFADDEDNLLGDAHQEAIGYIIS